MTKKIITGLFHQTSEHNKLTTSLRRIELLNDIIELNEPGKSEEDSEVAFIRNNHIRYRTVSFKKFEITPLTNKSYLSIKFRDNENKLKLEVSSTSVTVYSGNRYLIENLDHSGKDQIVKILSNGEHELFGIKCVSAEITIKS